MTPKQLYWVGCKRGLPNQIEESVREGVDVKIVDGLLNTGLHYAAGGGKTAAVATLLLLGADPNAVNRSGDTPLHKAAARGHKDAIRLLVNAKASIDIKNGQGHTPLDLAFDVDTQNELTGEKRADLSIIDLADD